MDYEYEPISLEEAMKLVDKGEKVYIQNPHCSDWYNEFAIDYNPDLTWGEIAHILHSTQMYKKVKIKGNK